MHGMLYLIDMVSQVYEGVQRRPEEQHDILRGRLAAVAQKF